MYYYLDYSDGPLYGQDIPDVYPGIIRYITSPSLMQPPNPGNPKHITRTEYNTHLQAGKDIWFVYQGTTTDADGGYAIGKRNALRVLDGFNYLGINLEDYYKGIFFTNDRTTLPSITSWRGYLQGAASVLGIDKVGAYGFGNAMDAAIGYATYFWQSGRRSDVRQFVHFWQDNNAQVIVNGMICDRNLVLRELPAPKPNPTPEETDMQLTDIVGVDSNGIKYTVKDVFDKIHLMDLTPLTKMEKTLSELKQQIDILPKNIKSLAEQKFVELSGILYTVNGQPSWALLKNIDWGDLSNRRWASI